MESPAERAERIARLETARAERHHAEGVTVWPTPDDSGMGVLPVEVAPGRGDLSVSSSNFPIIPTALALVGNRPVSFARIFQSQPWVAAAVMRLLTWSIRVPLKCYRRIDDDDSVQLQYGEHPLATAIERPWLGGSRADFVMALLGPIFVHGNSVTRVLSGSADSVEFRAKDWRFSRPMMPFRDSIDGWTFDWDSPAYRDNVSADEVLHCRYWSPTGPVGTSPLQQLGVTLQIEDAAQRWQRNMMRNAARPPSAVVMSPEFLKADPKDRLKIIAQVRADMTDIYSGPENAGRPALLPPGLDWKTVGHTSVEAELIEQRRVDREEVAGVYLIPPPLLGILDKATYANIEVQRDMTYTDCLGPHLVLAELAFNAQVCRDLLQEPDIYVGFDFEAVLRGDRLQEINALRGAVSSALMTPNESRRVIGKPKSSNPAMDEFYLPSNNLQPIGSPAASGGSQPPNVDPLDPTAEPGEPNAPNRGRNGRRLHVRSFARDFDMAVR